MIWNRSHTFVVAVALAFITNTSQAEHGVNYWLVFPHMELDSKLNQAIEEISFTVACGHIESVARIPDLWNIEIQRAVSATEEFHASAGLGTARLQRSSQWDNSILINQVEASCFNLTGSIIVGGEKYLEVPLTKVNLRKALKAK